MYKIPSKYSSLLFVVLISLLWTNGNRAMGQSLSQTSPDSWDSNWNLSLNVGVNQFYGDVNNHTFFQKLSKESPLGIQLNLTKMVHPSWGVGVNLNYAGIKSLKNKLPDGTQVSFTLSGMYYSANPYLYLNLNDLIFGFKADRFWALYTKTGIGYAFWNTTLTNNITSLQVKSGETVGNHTYAKHALEVPLNVGLRFHVSSRMSLDLGVEFNTIMSDDVDLWNEGYKYDRFTYVYGGLTYSLDFLHHLRSKRFRKENTSIPKGKIPLYDYTFFGHPDQSLPKSNSERPQVDALKIDKPIAPHATNINQYHPVIHQGVEFRVQIMAADKKVGTGKVQAKFNLSVPVEEVHQNGFYRYTVGHFNNYQSAWAESRKMRAQGVYDAFVTAYRNGLRIPLTGSMMK